jgi:predicted transcriptional regulator
MTRFTFTRPITKSGRSDFFNLLVKVNSNFRYTWKDIHRYHMTFQCMAEAGLIHYKITPTRNYFEITEKGSKYVQYVKSSNKPNRNVLKCILESNI